MLNTISYPLKDLQWHIHSLDLEIYHWILEASNSEISALDERLFTLCEFNEIEDESHILFQRSRYGDLRSKWASHIVNKALNFLELDRIDKSKVIFDTQHRITACLFCAVIIYEKKIYPDYNVLCALYLCICITNVYYSLLVEMVCSIHVCFVRRYGICVIMQPYIHTCFKVTLWAHGAGPWCTLYMK